MNPRARIISNFPLVFFLSVIVWLGSSSGVSALTLEESIALAKKNLPFYQAAMKRVMSSEALYKASYGPYLPSVDVGGSQEWHDDSVRNYDSTNYDATASLLLFDGGKREANKDIAKYTFESEREELRKTGLQVEFDVKVSFYTAIATRDILNARTKQLDNAKKDFEVAEGRYKFGVAKRSDVLQASVRLEQAKFNLIQAEGNVIKALSELSSLIGKPYDETRDIQGSLETAKEIPEESLLARYVLIRPEIKQSEYAVKKAESGKMLSYSPFFPSISANAAYTNRSESNITGGSFEDRAAFLTATWNIFELGKFYRAKSAKIDVGVSEDNLRELKRQLMLDLRKEYENFLTAAKNVDVAVEQLKQAEQNYEQAFGEYKVGKGDILSVVVAEGLLQTAREQATTSRLNHILSKSLLERTAGIERMEGLREQPAPPPEGNAR